MMIGYARVSKTDGSQVLDLQIDALKKVGVDENRIYHDHPAEKIHALVLNLALRPMTPELPL
jgi:DNA invertase Pin-like site-specific DNA recombinase